MLVVEATAGASDQELEGAARTDEGKVCSRRSREP